MAIVNIQYDKLCTFFCENSNEMAADKLFSVILEFTLKCKGIITYKCKVWGRHNKDSNFMMNNSKKR